MISVSFPDSRFRIQAVISPVQMLLRMTGSYCSGGNGDGRGSFSFFLNKPIQIPSLKVVISSIPQKMAKMNRTDEKRAKLAVKGSADLRYSIADQKKESLDEHCPPGIRYQKTNCVRSIQQSVPPAMESIVLPFQRWSPTVTAHATICGAQEAGAVKLRPLRQ